MKRKMIYLPSTYSKDVLDEINGYFDKGYEIEDVFSADLGVYLIFVLKYNEIYNNEYKLDLSDYTKNLIEEVYKKPECTTTNTIVNVEEIYKKPEWATTCTNIN
jgi:hypothetical protein